MINEISDDGFVDISDSISSSMPGSGHGYNTLMSTRKLYNSNTSLSKGEFDWKPYLKHYDHAYNQMEGTETTKDLRSSQHLKNVRSNGMKEKLDLSGRVVVVKVTELGKTMIKK